MRMRAKDLQPDAAELAAARRAAKAPGEATAWGGGIGTALGALGFLVPGAGAVVGPATMAAGGALGSAIGGSVGNAQADDAEKLLRAREAARAKKMAAHQEREAAYAELMRR